jgi:hypothetical protein
MVVHLMALCVIPFNVKKDISFIANRFFNLIFHYHFDFGNPVII